MNFNFDCDIEFVNAIRMYNNGKPNLKEQIYHYIYMLDKKEKGLLNEFLKVRSAGSMANYGPV